MTYEYTLPHTQVTTTVPLTAEVQKDLAGEYRGSLRGIITKHHLPSKVKLFPDCSKYYYCPGLGLIKASNWKDYLPSAFVNGEITATQMCVELGVPRSLLRFLQTDPTYVAHITSPAYKHMLGVLNHTTHTCYGKIANARKTNDVRNIDRSVKSYARVEKLLSDNHLKLLDSWTGTRQADGTVKSYRVQCTICGTVYTTTLHSSTCNVCPQCKAGSWCSEREGVMKAFIESYGITVLQSYRGLIKSPTGLPMELDLYLPDLNIAFEFNGYRYHYFPLHPADYHEWKTEKCLQAGVKLYHIWSDMSDELCKSIILSKIGKSCRIYARNCSIGPGTSTFFKENHVDGDARAFYRKCLYYQGVPVAGISARAHKDGVEIARFANKLGVTVVGGYSKLLKDLINQAQLLGYTKLISYCNRDISPDPHSTFYAKYGFTYVGKCSLILKYTNFKPLTLNGTTYKSNSVIPRQRCQKHILLKELGLQSSNLTEGQLANELGIYQVFNSGNFRYELNITKP